MKNKINMFESLENRTLLAAAADADAIKAITEGADCNIAGIMADFQASVLAKPEAEQAAAVKLLAANILESCAASYAKKSAPVRLQQAVLTSAISELTESLAGAGGDADTEAIINDSIAEISAESAQNEKLVNGVNNAIKAIQQGAAKLKA